MEQEKSQVFIMSNNEPLFIERYIIQDTRLDDYLFTFWIKYLYFIDKCNNYDAMYKLYHPDTVIKNLEKLAEFGYVRIRYENKNAYVTRLK